uniref:Zgc:112416 n=1 Tax=Cyprinus carpio TaxID=7962 RepID=A0A8C2B5L5_CYPCA
MADPAVDQMTRLRLKMLEKRLENERNDNIEREGSAFSTRSYDGQADALHGALRRKRNLLQRLREQHMMEDLGRPHTWGGSRRQYHYQPLLGPLQPVPPIHIHQTAPPAPLPPLAPQPPQIIQHTVPQQPATIIQQLPQQQPLIAQFPPPQTFPYRSGSIKEDMVELMLMQNAQMHQIIMHNMMLKALPPTAVFPGGSNSQITPLASHSAGQDLQHSTTRGGVVHHHHHYGSHVPPLPPIGYSFWPSLMPAGQAGTHQPTVQPVIGPVNLPPLNTMGIDAVNSRTPLGL